MTVARRRAVLAVMAIALLLPAASIAGPPDSGQGGRTGDRGQPKKDDKPRKKGDPGKPAKKQGDQKTPPKNLAVKAMRLVIEEAVFEDMTFEDFAEWLSRKTKANVVVRWKVLEKAGVERDCPINIKRRDCTIRELLRLVFEQVTEDLPTVELAAKADGNTLILSTREEINAKRFARVYDVQDLLISVPNFKAMDIGDERGPGIRAHKGVGDGTKRGQKEPECPPEAQLLIDLITKHIQPLSWKVNGGKGTIVFYKGRLVVYNNIEVHQQIGGAIVPEKKK